MADNTNPIELEEEEYTTPLTAPIFKRILGLLHPHWKWVVGFIITIAFTSILDSVFTYINKDMIDQGIVAKNINILWRTHPV
jgi:ATP-binding cassette subfamily B protein